MKQIKIHDKEFKLYLPYEKIRSIVVEMAEKMNNDLSGKNPLFVCILNGSFMFAAELYKHIDLNDSEISFVKLASYNGDQTSGSVKELIGLNEDIKGRTVIILEDIVDTGITIDSILKQLAAKEPKEVLIATLLFKPEALQKDIPLHYVGLKIPNDFIVGYGLDYNGYGRNLIDFYSVINTLKFLHMLNLVLFGPPGAGKGTQAEFIINTFELKHLSTGDLLRNEIAAGTKLGLEAKAFMDKGELVPDAVVIGMIKCMLEASKDAKGFIFDGFPRTVQQAKALDELLRENGTGIAGMLSLEVEKQELIDRLLSRGKISSRSDDQDQSIIENRINVYNQKTLPLIEYYQSQGKHLGINGMGTIEEIAQRIKTGVEKLKKG